MLRGSLRLAARCAGALALMVALSGALWFERWFVPKAEPWPFWLVSDESNAATVPVAAWNRWLARHLRAGPNGVNRIDYGTVTGAERAALDRLIADWTELPIRSYRRREQLAYWINLYNAVTVQVVLAHYPVASIRDIDTSPGLFADGPWDAKAVEVEGTALSLNDIEHRILRPGWHDPRIHYTVNCASIGCPNLAATAYRSATIESDLDRAARAYVNDPRGTRFTDQGLMVSKIYFWFQEDFGGSEGAVLAHLRRFARPALRARLAGVTEIAGATYDWRLNDGAR